jgi:hypothetical protein
MKETEGNREVKDACLLVRGTTAVRGVGAIAGAPLSQTLSHRCTDSET